MGEDERIVTAENVLKSQARYRMSQIESGGTWYYRAQIYTGRIRSFSSSLWLCASYYSTDTLLQFLPLFAVYIFLGELDSLDCLTQKRLDYFPWHDSSVLIFSLHPFGFCSTPWDLGKDFSPWEKTHPYHKVCIVPGYVLDICSDKTEGITVTSLNVVKERQWCIVLLEVVESEQFVIELNPSMKMINRTHRIYIAHIIYKAKSKRILKRIPFLNISFFKDWCGGNLAVRIIKFIWKVLLLLENYMHSLFPSEMQWCVSLYSLKQFVQSYRHNTDIIIMQFKKLEIRQHFFLF